MASEIRICPNCGAGVVGSTTNCPRCDYPLSAAAISIPQRLVPFAEPEPEDGDSLQPITALNIQPIDMPLASEHDEAEDEETPVEFATAEHEVETRVTDSGELFENAQTVAVDPALIGMTAPEGRAAETRIASGTGIFENAQTADVDPALIGVTGSEPPVAETRENVRPEVSIPAPAPSPLLASVPAAPYTAPPLREPTVSVAPYSFPSNYYLEQRIAAYRQGGYELKNYSPYQVTMQYGKPLGFFWWLLAMLSGIGLMWYVLILLSSGFSKDRVFLIIERDGTLYEDGAGAAHVRRKRSRVGRRWGFLGVVVFFIALLWFVGMVAAAVFGIQRYRSELQAAYPDISLFTTSEITNQTEPDPDAVSTAQSGVLAFSILSVLSIVCMMTGLSLTIVGYLHSAAYDVPVPPLPMYG